MKRLIISSLCGAVILSASTTTALAYIDPITGSIVIQTVVGALAATAVAIRSVREKIISLFVSKKPDKDENA